MAKQLNNLMTWKDQSTTRALIGFGGSSQLECKGVDNGGARGAEAPPVFGSSYLINIAVYMYLFKYLHNRT